MIAQVPEVPEVMPSDWRMEPTGMRVSVAPTDELNFPFDKRGLWVKTPDDPQAFEAFANSLADQVRITVLAILRKEEVK